MTQLIPARATLREAYQTTLEELHAAEQHLLDALCVGCHATTDVTHAQLSEHLARTRTQAIRAARTPPALNALLHDTRTLLDTEAPGAALLAQVRRVALHLRTQYEAACRYALILNDMAAFELLVLALDDAQAALHPEVLQGAA